MSEDGKPALDPRAELLVRQEVTKIVGGWAKIIGIANLALIIPSLGYIYFALPKQAATEARISASGEVQAEVTRAGDQAARLFSTLNAQLERSLERSGELKERHTAIESRLGNLRPKIDEIETTTEKALAITRDSAVGLLAEIQARPDAKQILEENVKLRAQMKEFVEQKFIKSGDKIHVQNIKDGASPVPIMDGASKGHVHWEYGDPKSERQQMRVTLQ